MSNNLAERKSLLAKLLAKENITIRHANVPTASFDTLHRVLTCPIWKDMDGFLYDLIMGHEVGHALYTPTDEWFAYGKKNGQKKLSVLNVVEDARIEKKIKRPYPGLRKSFFSGYKELLDRDFFKIKELGGDTSKLNLIDRLNMYFKCGPHLVIKFSEEEQKFVKMTENCETFDEACKITDLVCNYIKENEKDKVNSSQDLKDLIEAIKNGEVDFVESEESQEESENDESTGSDDKESSGESPDEEDNSKGDESSASDEENAGKDSGNNGKEQEKSDVDSDGSADEKSEEEKTTSGGKQGSLGGQSEIEPESVTESAQREKEKELIDNKAKPWVLIDLPECDLKKTIVPNRTLINAFEEDAKRVTSSSVDYTKIATEVYNKFYAVNSKYIGLLVKEFEMRKNATQYNRQLESKSGELDTRRLANYRFSGDIFRKVTEVPKGKSHGMIMFVDMSSSMSPIMNNTMQQTVIKALFCKKVGIPFCVYGFSDAFVSYGYISYKSNKFNPKTPAAFSLGGVTGFHLKELISSELNAKDFRRSVDMMLLFGVSYGSNSYNFGNCGQMGLSGTPLIETLVASKTIINQFKSKTHVDIVNVVYLTDGEGGVGITMPPMYNNVYVHDLNHHTIGFVDPTTKNRVMVKDYGNGNRIQAALTELIRQSTNCRHIGFYIGDSYIIDAVLDILSKERNDKNNNTMSYDELTKHKQNVRDNGYFSTSNLGYDSYYYVVMRNGNIQTDDKIIIGKNASVENIKAAALRCQKRKMSNRALVTQFASEIAS